MTSKCFDRITEFEKCSEYYYIEFYKVFKLLTNSVIKSLNRVWIVWNKLKYNYCKLVIPILLPQSLENLFLNPTKLNKYWHSL